MDDEAERASVREVGTILRSLYIALGAATLIGDDELLAILLPVVLRYRDKTRAVLEGTPYDI